MLRALPILAPALLLHSTLFAESIHAIEPVFQSVKWPTAEIDSMAVWEGGATPLLYVTGKQTDEVYEVDALSGRQLRVLGGEGSEFGELDRPNGIAVWRDLLFVVERNNGRVQVFALPAATPVATFGEGELSHPYGIAILDRGDGCDIYITDDYAVAADRKDRLKALDRRVKQYHWTEKGEARLRRSFGATSEAGALQVVETIAVDPMTRRLLICDEERKIILVYTLGGRFTGQVIGDGIFDNDPEGIILTGNHIVVSDQGDDVTMLRIFDRRSGKFLGTSSAGTELGLTDGMTSTDTEFGLFRGGALFAAHQDYEVRGFALEDVLAGIQPAGGLPTGK